MGQGRRRALILCPALLWPLVLLDAGCKPDLCRSAASAFQLDIQLGGAAGRATTLELKIDAAGRHGEGQVAIGALREGRTEIVVDGQPAGRTPLRHSLYLLPGRHRLTLTKGPRSLSLTLLLAAGERREVKAAWPSAPAPARLAVSLAPPVVATPRPGGQELRADLSRRGTTPLYRRWWFWTLVGGVIAGTTAGVVASQTGGSDRLPRGDGLRIPLR